MQSVSRWPDCILTKLRRRATMCIVKKGRDDCACRLDDRTEKKITKCGLVDVSVLFVVAGLRPHGELVD